MTHTPPKSPIAAKNADLAAAIYQLEKAAGRAALAGAIDLLPGFIELRDRLTAKITPREKIEN